MPELSYMIGGQSVTATELAQRIANAPKVSRPKTSSGLTRVDRRADAKLSLGFVVAGFSPEKLTEAQSEHEKARAEAIAHNRVLPGSSPDRKPIPPEWDEERYMRDHKPGRARSRPYEIRSSADQCAAMLRSAGWKNVTITEKLRG